jgi:hypothetical protein
LPPKTVADPFISRYYFWFVLIIINLLIEQTGYSGGNEFNFTKDDLENSNIRLHVESSDQEMTFFQFTIHPAPGQNLTKWEGRVWIYDGTNATASIPVAARIVKPTIITSVRSHESLLIEFQLSREIAIKSRFSFTYPSTETQSFVVYWLSLKEFLAIGKHDY